MRFILALALVMIGARPLWAETTRSAATVQEARAAFEAATTEYNLGHFAEALTEFERGYRLSSNPAFLVNIGQCQRLLHHPREAAHSYRRYLRETKDLAQRASVERLIAQMDAEAARESTSPVTSETPTTTADATSARAEPVRSDPSSAVAAPVLVQAVSRPVRKRHTALWIGLGVASGVVVAGVAIGLGVGLSSHADSTTATLGTLSVRFR